MKNSPINKLQQLMVITAEECGELTQRCSKVIRKFKHIEDITDAEINDVFEEFCDPATGLMTYEQYEKMIY